MTKCYKKQIDTNTAVFWEEQQVIKLISTGNGSMQKKTSVVN